MYSQHDVGNLFETGTVRSRRQEVEETLSIHDQRDGGQWKESTQFHKNDYKNNRTAKTRIIEARNETNHDTLSSEQQQTTGKVPKESSLISKIFETGHGRTVQLYLRT